MKYWIVDELIYHNPVAPFAGAWIEILSGISWDCGAWQVAPFAGAWIEIVSAKEHKADFLLSLPSRERGLKLLVGTNMAWLYVCRSLRGSVD